MCTCKVVSIVTMTVEQRSSASMANVVTSPVHTLIYTFPRTSHRMSVVCKCEPPTEEALPELNRHGVQLCMMQTVTT